MIEDQEEWRPIPGWEGAYEASSLGRVRSLDRVTVRHSKHGRPFECKLRGKVLAQAVNSTGYRSICIRDVSGDSETLVHRVVCAAFHGPAPAGMEVAHGDGDPSNNRPSNLRWTTKKGNHADKLIHGTALVAEANHQSKFTRRQRAIIRKISGVSHGLLAELLGVSQTTISAIYRNQSDDQQKGD